MECGFPFLGENCGFVSIELDVQRALALGKMRGCPVVPVDFLLPDMSDLDNVVLGDVRDRRWIKLTLSWHFRLLLQSPPCTSFSGGGNRLGIHVEAGQLLLHGLGIVAVVHAEVTCGENVKGLIRHGHWSIIGLFAYMLGLGHLLVKLLGAFAHRSYAKASVLLSLLQEKFDFSNYGATELALPAELWQLSDIYVEGIDEEQKRVLSVWELLPYALKKVCPRTPGPVLDARVQNTLPLPVLMSSYMHQHRLPWETLVSKGLFTWLVRFGQKTRYLHPCEVARLFGFGPGFCFGTDLDMDLSAFGNAVAPIQVLQILRPIFCKFGILQVLHAASLREVVALMVCGWMFLGPMALRAFGQNVRFVRKELGLVDRVVLCWSGTLRTFGGCPGKACSPQVLMPATGSPRCWVSAVRLCTCSVSSWRTWLRCMLFLTRSSCMGTSLRCRCRQRHNGKTASW